MAPPPPLFYEGDSEAREMGATLFRRLDRDRNGFLSQEELLHARTVLLCSEDTGQQVIASLSGLDGDCDKNGDSMIDTEEWHDFVGSLYEVLGRKQFLLMAHNWVSAPDGDVGDGGCKIQGECATDAAPAAAEVSAGEDGGSDAAMQAAAIHIQSVHRGKKARATLKKQKPQPARRTSVSDSTEQKPTSLMEYWEMLVTGDGIVKTSIDAYDLVQAFERSKLKGLDSRLVTFVPMQFADLGEPEDLSPGEVAHLCMMIIENPTLTVWEARAGLEPVKAACREDEAAGEGCWAVAPGSTLSYKTFKNLMPMLASIMRIDLQYLVSQLAWLRTGRFEMPNALATVLIEKCVNKPCLLGNHGPLPRNSHQTPDALWDSLASGVDAGVQGPSTEVLSKKFSLDDFVRLCYNAGIVDSTGKSGITYPDMSGLFTRTISRLPDLLRAHAERVKKPPAGLAKGRADYYMGRTELEVLMEELHREPALQRLHPSPLDMVLRLIQTCAGPRTRPEEFREAEAAAYVVKEASQQRRRGSWK